MNRSQALRYITQLSEKGELEEATHRYALIVVDLINDAVSEELLGCHTPDELAIWIRRDALAWQAEMDIAIFRKSLPWMNTFLFEQSTCSYFLWCQSICSQLGNQALMMKYKF